MKRRVICLLTALCLLFVLTGCTDSSMEEKHAPAPTLPPAEDRYNAPDGDESLGMNKEYRMYFPRTDGLYLVSRTTEVDGENLLDTVEHLLLNLFAFKGSLGFSRQEHWSGLPFPSPMHASMLSHFSCV